MKIVYLIDQTHLHGGIEKILSQKANYLADVSKDEVFIVTTEQLSKQPCYNLSPVIKQIDLNIPYIRNKSYYHPINIKNIFLNYVRLKKLLKRIKPDVVISKSFSPDQYLLPFLSLPKIIKEIHFSGSVIEKGLNFLDTFLFKKIIKKYDHLVILNQDEKQYYKYGNLKVISNFISCPDTTSFGDKENIIIAAGRLAPVKQFDHLIKAWSIIAYQFPGWEVHIYGQGSEHVENELNKLIVNLKLNSTVKLLGVTSHLQDKLELAKIYAMTSATECFPMVLLEAMNAGCVCVSYDCPNGPRNIIVDNFDGLLVEDQNIEDFSVKISQIIRDENKRIIFAQNAEIRSLKFSEGKIMNEWLNLFKR